MSVIELKNVRYVYGKKTPYEKCALDNISLQIKENTVTGLIGHTGSGKSTLVQMFNGLLKPDMGEVYVDGVNIWDKPKEMQKIRFKVGMVMQYPEYQLFADTVWEDIAYGPKNMGISGDELKERVEKSARFCGLKADVLAKSPFDLSGGQKRRVALAGIMAMEPKVLVLDEPAAGLDPRGRSEILGGICQYQRESGTTVVIVSHSMEDMAKYCDEIFVMSHAKLILHGDCKEVFSQSEVLHSAGLDVPEISGLIRALRKKDVDISKYIYTVDGAVEEICKYVRGDQDGI